jgi:hypothetical protein
VNEQGVNQPAQMNEIVFLQISLNQWLSIIKLFELCKSAKKSCKDVAVNYKMIRKDYNLLKRVGEYYDPEQVGHCTGIAHQKTKITRS